MPERIAKIDQDYAGRRVKAGETFEVEPQLVHILEALGRLEPEAQRESGGGEYRTREMSSPKPRRQRVAGR